MVITEYILESTCPQVNMHMSVYVENVNYSI